LPKGTQEKSWKKKREKGKGIKPKKMQRERSIKVNEWEKHE